MLGSFANQPGKVIDTLPQAVGGLGALLAACRYSVAVTASSNLSSRNGKYPGEANERTQYEEEKREPRGPPGLRHRDGWGHLRHGR
jgi:hypothetical protein